MSGRELETERAEDLRLAERRSHGEPEISDLECFAVRELESERD